MRNRNKIVAVFMSMILVNCNAKAVEPITEIVSETTTEAVIFESTITENPEEPPHYANLISSDGEWNNWQLKIPVDWDSTDCFLMKISFPADWKVAEQERQSQSYWYPFYFYKNIDLDNETVEIEMCSIISVDDHKNSERWREYIEKLDAIKQQFLPGQESKGGIDNTLMVDFEETNGRKWLLRSAFYLNGYMPVQYADMNFCRAYTAYDDRYEIGFTLDIRDKDLDDQPTRQLITKILESCEIVKVESDQ